MDYLSGPNKIARVLVRERQECDAGGREGEEQTSHRMWPVSKREKARNGFSLSHQREYSSVCALMSGP